MEKGKRPEAPGILPVSRTKEEAKRSYDRISKVYDFFAEPFERKHAETALEHLSIKEGETVLEIGFGTGHCLKRIAEAVGKTGRVYGVDISSGMLEVTRRRLGKARLMERVELHCADALSLPYTDDTFDAAFMSFTLELFDTPEIPRLLKEVKRVLKPGGRIGVASMSKENGESLSLRLYEWAHRKWPKYVDCRPIYVEQSLRDAGYEIREKDKEKLFGLPGEIVVAVKES
ncbi:MAG: methyltransferase domain-containing protein [Chloroflexi bacterium]|nr:methyltransferase domain-containing protein [Chloroflexota bacterium]